MQCSDALAVSGHSHPQLPAPAQRCIRRAASTTPSSRAETLAASTAPRPVVASADCRRDCPRLRWFPPSGAALAPRLRQDPVPRGPCPPAASAASGLGVEPSSVPQPQAETPGGEFVWEENWYPIGLIRDFDKRIPEAVTILGIPLVVWWDKVAGQFQVFQDLCPHRLAPLSEGRIHESGALQCSYHGWTFKGDGACTMIPQAPKNGPPVNASPKACARVFPSTAHQGILWVWAQVLSPSSLALSQATPIPTVPALDDPSCIHHIGQADLGYGQETLVENLVDPSHVPFAHHNIDNQGNREDGMPLDFFVRKVSEAGVVAQGLQYAQVQFHAPCLITIDSPVMQLVAAVREHRKQKQLEKEVKAGLTNVAAKAATSGNGAAGSGRVASADDSKDKEVAAAGTQVKEKKLSLAFYCIPRSPGFSRLIFVFSFNFLPKWVSLIPEWINHLSRILVLDSDHYLLHLQERLLEAEGGQCSALKAYFTPTRADAVVCAFRRWFNEQAGGRIQWPHFVDPALPPVLPRRQLMDRQITHVRICKSCRAAQKWFERINLGLQIGAFLALAAMIFQSVTRSVPLGLLSCLTLVAFSTVCALGSVALSKFVYKNYHFHDYCHALVP